MVDPLFFINLFEDHCLDPMGPTRRVMMITGIIRCTVRFCAWLGLSIIVKEKWHWHEQSPSMSSRWMMATSNSRKQTNQKMEVCVIQQQSIIIQDNRKHKSRPFQLCPRDLSRLLVKGISKNTQKIWLIQYALSTSLKSSAWIPWALPERSCATGVILRSPSLGTWTHNLRPCGLATWEHWCETAELKV